MRFLREAILGGALAISGQAKAKNVETNTPVTPGELIEAALQEEAQNKIDTAQDDPEVNEVMKGSPINKLDTKGLGVEIELARNAALKLAVDPKKESGEGLLTIKGDFL